MLEYVTAGSFPDIAHEYRLIKQDAINVLVPYQLRIEEFNKLNDEGNKVGLTSEWIKRARPLTVSIYRPKPDDTIWDSLIPVKVAGRKEREQNDWFIYIRKRRLPSNVGTDSIRVAQYLDWMKGGKSYAR